VLGVGRSHVDIVGAVAVLRAGLVTASTST